MQPRAYMYMCVYTYGYVGVYVRNLLLVLFLCRTLTDTIIFFSSNLPYPQSFSYVLNYVFSHKISTLVKSRLSAFSALYLCNWLQWKKLEKNTVTMPGFTLNPWLLTSGGPFVLPYNLTVLSQSTQIVYLLLPLQASTPSPPCSLSAGDLAFYFTECESEHPWTSASTLQISHYLHLYVLLLFLLGWLYCPCFCLRPAPPHVHWYPFGPSLILSPFYIPHHQYCPHLQTFPISNANMLLFLSY